MESIFELLSCGESETEDAGSYLAKLINAEDKFPSFIAMYGDLGAGKTAFVRGMASVLTPESAVSSPTYAIINIYSSDKYILYHLDLYRITGEDDLYSVGFDELFDINSKKVVIAAEWCENIQYSLPESYIRVVFTKTNENGRLIKAEKINRG
ncbi:MAG: tRNA (adenosine(37)-N6)-threonylcarbamoyltransferase complex ATPase subunit type 1 TsaE [Eubacteriales bacterium]